MALADRKIEAKHSGTPCSIGYALEHLPEEDREWLVQALGTKERRGKDASVIWGTMHDERRDILAEVEAAETAAANWLAEDPPNHEKADSLHARAHRLSHEAQAYNVGLQTVNRHRGEKCRCYKDAA